MTGDSDRFWSPTQYSLFADHRLRPGIDLLNRIMAGEAAAVVDLGCGSGNLTKLLHLRWPHARIVGIDSSLEMLAAARTNESSIEWLHDDIAHWEPEAEFDVVFSNAALHWLPNHQELIPRLLTYLRPSGTLAIQMPDNWDQPTHTIPERVLEQGQWPEGARTAFLRQPVARPHEYRRWLESARTVDIWQTTYQQVLAGNDPVFEWMRGSVLAPVLNALSDEHQDRFAAMVKASYADVYPQQSDGTTILPFTRMFIIAVK
ncbi:MAG TPA: methyltransferase domain-containing protein [Acidimicrobiia bacterium]|nr:methyltransferase domain-containing protein [Acidimicrobiia bacterium]